MDRAHAARLQARRRGREGLLPGAQGQPWVREGLKRLERLIWRQSEKSPGRGHMSMCCLLGKHNRAAGVHS